MKLRFWLFSVLMVQFLASCEKNVSFALKDEATKLVVEASIENNEPPRVVLSTSLAYFSEISPAILEKSFVHDAEVYISNGTHNHHLTEHSYGQNGYTFFYYSMDSASPSTAFLGQLN